MGRAAAALRQAFNGRGCGACGGAGGQGYRGAGDGRRKLEVIWTAVRVERGIRACLSAEWEGPGSGRDLSQSGVGGDLAADWRARTRRLLQGHDGGRDAEVISRAAWILGAR